MAFNSNPLYLNKPTPGIYGVGFCYETYYFAAPRSVPPPVKLILTTIYCCRDTPVG